MMLEYSDHGPVTRQALPERPMKMKSFTQRAIHDMKVEKYQAGTTFTEEDVQETIKKAHAKPSPNWSPVFDLKEWELNENAD